MQCCGVGVCSQLGTDARITHRPRHQRQRLEMLDTGIDRRKKGKDKVHWLPVYSVKIQGLVQPQECAGDVIEPAYPGMGQGDPVTDAGRAKALAFQQRIDHIIEVEAEGRDCDLPQILKESLLARRLAGDLHGRRF